MTGRHRRLACVDSGCVASGETGMNCSARLGLLQCALRRGNAGIPPCRWVARRGQRERGMASRTSRLGEPFGAPPFEFAEQHAAEFGEVRWPVLELARPGFDDVLKGPASTLLATANLEFTFARASGIVHRVEPEQRLATLQLVARSEVGGLNGDNPERASLGASVVASAEQLPTSRKAAVGALDFGRRESGTERRHPAGAKRIDDRLGDRLCRSPFSACGMPECRKRVVLGRRSLARPARSRYDGQTQDEEARRGHVRTISRRPSTRLGGALQISATPAL